MSAKRILLHICCAPCALQVVEALRHDFSVSGFFYNPNIHPFAEHEFRRAEVVKAAAIIGLDVLYASYEIAEWFARVRGLKHEPERGKRCAVCFAVRLEKAFAWAAGHGFGMVASTLSLSPYKDTAMINAVGLALAEQHGLSFLAENFKKHDGFRRSCALAAKMGIRHQNYCGCAYSLAERLRRSGAGQPRPGKAG